MSKAGDESKQEVVEWRKTKHAFFHMQNLALRYIQIDMYTYMSMKKIKKTLCERESRSARQKGG